MKPPALAPALLAVLLPCLGAAQERVPWMTSRVRGTPEPPLPFRVERAFPQDTFEHPMEAATIPGTERLVVLEMAGRILSLRKDERVAKAEVFAELAQFEPELSQCFGLTFHPRFAENRYAYVWLCLNLQGKPTREDGTHIVRFRVTEENPPRLDLASGTLIFSWLGGGHNGGNLRFGPDGMLYLGAGDASPPDPPDIYATGQDLRDLLSSVLRIDVDHPDASRTYGIPRDNPFTATPGARGEVWAYGLRNPWRIAFDPRSGELYAGDVGWELWEVIYRIQRGGNYGWSITEGSRQDVRPERARGPGPIRPPLVAHSHEEAASITGGEFYHGTRLPELAGSYVYGDWQLGTFWSLRAEGDRVVEHRELCHSALMPVGFGIAPDGELLICDYTGGGLWRLARNPDAGQASKFPRQLSETGIFVDLVKETPAPGVVPYAVNAARWADHATAARWIAVPGDGRVTVATESLGVMGKGRWVFPNDTVFAKTYSLEMERGNAATRRRIETQVLHFDGVLWRAYSYRWNDAQTDATLVSARGDEAIFPVKDSAAPGGELTQRWRFFSRAECLRCHNLWNNFAPGYSAPQLARLDALAPPGLAPVEKKAAALLRPDGSVEERARAYLHANCGSCHVKGGGGSVPTFLNIETPLKDARLLDARPVQGDLGLPDARIVAPGDPCRSVLLYRMATAGRGHMPYLGGRLVDERGVLLVRDWIASLSPITAPIDASSSALGDALAIMDGTLTGEARAQAIAKGSALADPLRRDLFERFLPESQRRRVLGSDLQPDALLAMKGDAARGRVVFAGLCAACHRVNGQGLDFGPDLTHIAAKWNRPAMLEQILAPSKVIDPAWQLTAVELRGGETKSGFIQSRDATLLTLKMPGGLVEKIPADQILKTTANAHVSAMPEALLQTLTATEAADLLEFLAMLTK